MPDLSRAALIAALQWQIDAGADEAYADAPGIKAAAPVALSFSPGMAGPVAEDPQSLAPTKEVASRSVARPVIEKEPVRIVAGSAARTEAARAASAAQTLEDLRAAIADFPHLTLRETAKNLVFSDGNPRAQVMLIGEAPGADEDLQGKPFVGASGQLLDRILGHIGLSRGAEDAANALYIANILNWRPPGNRTPTPEEIEMSLPFIERHIELIRPRLLILAGGVAAKALLRSDLGISKLRGRWHDITLPNAGTVSALATYHPAFLLRTPSQKRAVWQDMLAIQARIRSIIKH